MKGSLIIKYPPYINILLLFVHIMVIDEYWDLVESRITLQLWLGGVSVVHFLFFLINKTETIVCFLVLALAFRLLCHFKFGNYHAEVAFKSALLVCVCVCACVRACVRVCVCVRACVFGFTMVCL